MLHLLGRDGNRFGLAKLAVFFALRQSPHCFRQVSALRNLWAHRRRSNAADPREVAIEGLRKLREIISLLMMKFDRTPSSLHVADVVTAECIRTLENIDDYIDQRRSIRVDLFSMTIVFFERALVRYQDACLNAERYGRLVELPGEMATLKYLLRKFPSYDDKDYEVLRPFLGNKRPSRKAILVSIAGLEVLLKDDVDKEVLQPLFEHKLDRLPEPLSIITAFMEEKRKMVDADGQKYGQLPFFLVSLARNRVYHGQETPKVMALLIATCIEIALLMLELNGQNAEHHDFVSTLKECEVVLSWITSPWGTTEIDIRRLLEAAADERYVLEDAHFFPNHFERLRRIIRNEQPVVCSFPRLFTCRPDFRDFDSFVRPFEKFYCGEVGYRKRDLLEHIRRFTDIDVEDIDALDGHLKDWLFRHVIPESEFARCHDFRASDLIGSQLAWLEGRDGPSFKTNCSSVLTQKPFGFDLNPARELIMRKIFQNRFQKYNMASSGYRIERPNARPFSFMFHLDELFNFNTKQPALSRFDFISMLLMMGADSESFGQVLREPVDIEDLERGDASDSSGGRGVRRGDVSSKEKTFSHDDDFDLKKATSAPRDRVRVPLWNDGLWSNVYEAFICRDDSLKETLNDRQKTLDSIAMRLREAGVSDDPTVLTEMSFKLRRGGVQSLEDFNLLNEHTFEERFKEQVKDLDLTPVQFLKLENLVVKLRRSSLRNPFGSAMPQSGGGLIQGGIASAQPSAATDVTGQQQPSEDLLQALNEHNLMRHWGTIYRVLEVTTLADLRRLNPDKVESDLKEAGMATSPREQVVKLCKGSFFDFVPSPDKCQIQ